MSRFTPLPILPTPGLDHPRLTRLRFMTADAGAAGTAGAPAAPAASAAPAAPVVDPAASGSTAPATAPTPADPAAASAPQAGAPAAGDGLPNDVDALKAMVADLRKENGKDRTTAKTAAADQARQELAQTIGKALGLVQDDTPPDPAQLATTAQEAVARANAAEVELAAYKAAGTHGANPVELLDRRSVTTQLDKLDPTADDFATQVDAIVKKAVTDNPQLLAQAPAAGASSTDRAGGTGELADLDAQIAAAEKAGDHRRAIQLKRQKARS